MYVPGPFPVNNAYTPLVPQIQQPVSQVIQPTSGPQLIRVNGIESAKAFQTVPNSTVALFDANEDVMYIKSTDASNFPSIRIFDFVERKQEVQNENGKYVTPEDLNKAITEVKSSNDYVTTDQLNKVINELREEIQNGKQFVRTISTESSSSNTNAPSKYTKSNNAGKSNNTAGSESQQSTGSYNGDYQK